MPGQVPLSKGVHARGWAAAPDKTHRAGTSGNVILAQIGFKAVRLMQPQIQCQTMGNYSQQITSMPGQ